MCTSYFITLHSIATTGSSSAATATATAINFDKGVFAANGLLDPKTEEELLKTAISKASAVGYNARDLQNMPWTI
jgi:hypothetical protein